MENGTTPKSHRRKGRQKQTESQFVKRWMVTLACGCACTILSMSLMVAVWRNRQLTHQVQFSMETQRFIEGARQQSSNIVHRRFQAYSKEQHDHHQILRNGERYHEAKYEREDSEESDGQGDRQTTRADSQSIEESKPTPVQTDSNHSLEIKSEKQIEAELLEKITRLRSVYNGLVAKHRQRRASGEAVSAAEEAAVMKDLKQLRDEYYAAVSQLKRLRSRMHNLEGKVKQQTRSERQRWAQKIQEEKNASKQLAAQFLKGEHRRDNIINAAMVNEYNNG